MSMLHFHPTSHLDAFLYNLPHNIAWNIHRYTQAILRVPKMTQGLDVQRSPPPSLSEDDEKAELFAPCFPSSTRRSY